MTNGIFDGLLDFGRMLFIEDDRVRVGIGLHHYELHFFRPDPERAASIRARQGDDGTIPIRMDLVNTDSGKPVRGFGCYIHPWWLRKFVYALAEGVAHTEREWDTMPQSFIDKMTEEEGKA